MFLRTKSIAAIRPWARFCAWWPAVAAARFFVNANFLEIGLGDLL